MNGSINGIVLKDVSYCQKLLNVINNCEKYFIIMKKCMIHPYRCQSEISLLLLNYLNAVLVLYKWINMF